MKKSFLLLFGAMWLLGQASAQQQQYSSSKFEQLGTMLPTPNSFRTADGSPGHEYWQQKADYKIRVELDDEKQFIKGTETITYTNNSPTEIHYLWLQLDQNLYDKNSDTYKTQNGSFDGTANFGTMRMIYGMASGGGYTIANVRDAKGKPLAHTINKTMMRIDLPQPLKARGGKVTFSLDWSFFVQDANKMGGRGGYEYFPADGNYLYEMAQWFPRMCVFDDVNGWQNKQFLGQGEFALTFGDYEVAITVPADHIVASTGELQNAKEVLSAQQISRLKQAENAQNPVLIVTQEEAVQAEKSKASGKKTWIYKAQNVRDFAWASSRKFIWDAMQVPLGGKKVWAMSYFPKEGNPLWGDKSTHTVAHTLRVYSKYTFDYPYPVAISVHGPVFGMEYPMICFNGGRPNPDGTVPDRTKYAMISVIIHEVGHNFFPMIVNSDERQWSWMDEGLNTFMQYLTEVEIPGLDWAKDVANPYPSSRGPARNIIGYMKSDPKTQVPIMTNSEQITQFGGNAYGKPATALNILRETIMGKELFDYAFKSYSNKWKFKHPEPADFFRTMEDASGVDLDWFWRGWFYTTEPCDISLEEVMAYKLGKPENTVLETKEANLQSFENIFARMEQNGLKPKEEEKALAKEGNYFYTLKVKNVGGLIMPLIVQMKFKDGSTRIDYIPAEVWRLNPEQVSKVFITDKEVVEFLLDPRLETADIDTNNNIFPRKAQDSKFDEIKRN